VWLAWPHDGELWQDQLVPAQREFVELCRAIADIDFVSGEPRGEQLAVLIPNLETQAQAEMALDGLPVRFFEIPVGDIWLRDTGPLFLKSEDGRYATVQFVFNGWGEKYQLPYDDQVAQQIAQVADLNMFQVPWVLEGGSVEVDGDGTCLTTEQCLLNENRNPGMTREQLELGLGETLGVKRVLWLRQGLLNDHTDGHIDTIARFVAPGVVVCMEAHSADDPNREVLNEIARDLAQMIDARGRHLRVVRVPSPGRVLDDEGQVMPASYVNFYIGNSAVVVPTYGTPFDDAAVAMIATYFPGRRTMGVSARAILAGGGAFHCISQQQPE
jgi:agmatine deiminase